ncbi:MAG: hypothetical protein ACJAX4_001517 [Clostridium sp.]|jgi:hypothetical protein
MNNIDYKKLKKDQLRKVIKKINLKVDFFYINLLYF